MKMDNGVQKTFIIVLGIIILSLIIILAIKSFLPSKNQIQINGQSEIEATPDTITVYYNLETTGTTSKKAEDKNSDILNNLTYQIATIGLNKSKLKTISFNVNPEYQWINNKNQLKDYKATHSLKIELSIEQREKIGNLIDAGTNAGAIIKHIKFELSPSLEQEYKAKAIQQASEDARTKAEALAKGFNKKVSKLVSVSLDNWNYSPWRVYDSTPGVKGISVPAIETEIDNTVTNINPNNQKVTASVNAIYKIR